MWKRMKDLARSAESLAKNAVAAGTEYLGGRTLILEMLRSFENAPGRAAQALRAKWESLSDPQRAAIANLVQAMLRAALDELSQRKSLGEREGAERRADELQAQVRGLQAIGRLLEGETSPASEGGAGATAHPAALIEERDRRLRQLLERDPADVPAVVAACADLAALRGNAGELRAEDLRRIDELTTTLAEADRIALARRREARRRRLLLDLVTTAAGKEVMDAGPRTLEDEAESLSESLGALPSLGMDVRPEALLLDMVQKLSDQERAAGTLRRDRQLEIQRLGARIRMLGDAPGREDRLWELCADFTALARSAPGTATAPAAAADAPLDDEAARRLAVLETLRGEVADGVASGRVATARTSYLRSLLAEAEAVSAMPRTTETERSRYRSRMASLMNRHLEALAAAGASPSPSSRGARLEHYARLLLAFSAQELTHVGAADGEIEAVGRLGQRVLELLKVIAELPDDRAACALERADMRRIFADARFYHRRRHLTLANPLWSSPPVQPEASGVFYAGGAGVGTLLEGVAAERDLTLRTPAAGRNPAQDCWNRLRACGIGVFDLTEYEPFERHGDLARAARVAAVCYGLGIAACLGMPTVIVARSGQALPFDLDIEPARLVGTARDGEVLGEAVDDALYGHQRANAGDSMRATHEHLLRTWGSVAADRAADVREMLDAVERDPIVARELLAHALPLVGKDPPVMIYPSWPGAYPDPECPLCFLVTAFRPHLEAPTEAVERACRAAHIEFLRGDRSLGSDVITTSIWDSICRAGHVVADLTDLNPNAAMELAMAHTLGRRVLVISQPNTRNQLPPGLAKVRVHYYSFGGDPGPEPLQEALRAFLR